VIEMKKLFAKVKVFQKRRAAGPHAQRILVIRYRNALLTRELMVVDGTLMRFTTGTELDLTNALSEIENADLPETMVALQMQEVAYQAALAATSRVARPWSPSSAGSASARVPCGRPSARTSRTSWRGCGR